MSLYDDLCAWVANRDVGLALSKLRPIAARAGGKLEQDVAGFSARWSYVKRAVGTGELEPGALNRELDALAGRLLTLLGDHRSQLDERSEADQDPTGFDGVELQRLMGPTSCLQSVAWLLKGAEVARAVCRITLPNRTNGTGFLIDGNRVITNWHVLREEKDATDATFHFNYEEGLDGSLNTPTTYRATADGFKSVREFDCAKAMLQPNARGPRLSHWGALAFADGDPPSVGDHVPIIQHPQGDPKKIAVTENRVIEVRDHRLRYTTDTMGGSSGAPVFNDRWQVVAIHHGVAQTRRTSTGALSYANQGILSRYVVSALDLASK